ncbi:MAG: low affinity iron permease family protein [Pseudorhodoplanes sp.]|uniref:low affinity iron permease family protein n=1 Tax=Pseudorhodoplanes sp. TaxID=1934341 RepID=UPI003D0A40BE
MRKTSRAREPSVSRAVGVIEKHKGAGPDQQTAFVRAACGIAHLAGKPATFLIAVALVVGWAISGPIFGFSDTWQLVINTSTTIITFLMVFLIQNTQNRDTAAIQIKLAELILRLDGADDKLATAEDLSDEELEHLHRMLKERAENAAASLDRRRGNKAA